MGYSLKSLLAAAKYNSSNFIRQLLPPVEVSSAKVPVDRGGTTIYRLWFHNTRPSASILAQTTDTALPSCPLCHPLTPPSTAVCLGLV